LLFFTAVVLPCLISWLIVGIGFLLLLFRNISFVTRTSRAPLKKQLYRDEITAPERRNDPYTANF